MPSSYSIGRLTTDYSANANDALDSSSVEVQLDQKDLVHHTTTTPRKVMPSSPCSPSMEFAASLDDFYHSAQLLCGTSDFMPEEGEGPNPTITERSQSFEVSYNGSENMIVGGTATEPKLEAVVTQTKEKNRGWFRRNSPRANRKRSTTSLRHLFGRKQPKLNAHNPEQYVHDQEFMSQEGSSSTHTIRMHRIPTQYLK